jgi:hypothetical protein
MPSPTDPLDGPPLSYAVVLGAPERQGDGARDGHTSYEMRTTVRDAHGAPVATHRVRRRFRDFVWLHSRLAAAFVLVPPLPEHGASQYFDRLRPDFVQHRLAALQRFLARVVRDDRLAAHDAWRHFVAEDLLPADKEPGPEPRPLDAVGDALLQALGSGAPDSQDPMRDAAKRAADAWRGIEDGLGRLAACERAMVEARLDRAMALEGLGTGTGPAADESAALGRIADRDACLAAMAHDYRRIFQSVLAMLRARDHRHAAHAGLAAHLASTCAVRDALRRGDTPAGVAAFLQTQVVDRLRGADPMVVRQQRLARLDGRAGELAAAVEASRTRILRLDAAVRDEWLRMLGLMAADWRETVERHERLYYS